MNAALFISLEYPVNAIFQLPFKSNSEVLDSPPLFLRTINYVSCWVSVSTRPFSIYFVIALCYGNIKLLEVYFNIHHNDPFRYVTQSNFYLRYSHREIILIDFNLTYSKKSEQNVCLIWYRIFDILSLNTITDTFQIQRFPWHTLPQYPTPKPLNMHFTSYDNIIHK